MSFELTFFLKSTTHLVLVNTLPFFYRNTFKYKRLDNQFSFTMSILNLILETHMYKIVPKLVLIITMILLDLYI
jgi:hypothetical protein